MDHNRSQPVTHAHTYLIGHAKIIRRSYYFTSDLFCHLISMVPPPRQSISAVGS